MATKEAGMGVGREMSGSVPEVPLTLSESHQSDGFLWPEALAEISFLPHYQPRLPPPRLKEEDFGSPGRMEPKAIQKKSFMARRSLAVLCVCVYVCVASFCGES